MVCVWCHTGCCQRQGRWLSLLDAAKFAGTNQLDLTRYDPDFVAVSFYKMFGFPTGLGCLLVKRDIAPVLHQRFVSGGTVAAIAATELFHEFRPGMFDHNLVHIMLGLLFSHHVTVFVVVLCFDLVRHPLSGQV